MIIIQTCIEKLFGGEGSHAGGTACWKKLIKIGTRSYWLKAFLTKSKSKLTENDNIINKLDAVITEASIINLVFYSCIFHKLVS